MREHKGSWANAHREAADVAHDLQDVLIHGDVKQVVLHLADDLAEIGQVAAQDVELVHAPEFMHDAALALQQLQEGPVGRIGAEFGVIRSRERHRARSVRVVMPESSWHSCMARKQSRMADGSRSNSFSSRMSSRLPTIWKFSSSGCGTRSMSGVSAARYSAA
jgi:hypothetical protein